MRVDSALGGGLHNEVDGRPIGSPLQCPFQNGEPTTARTLRYTGLMADFHQILFNMHIMYSLALGVWAAAAAVSARGHETLSGHYWGAVVVYALLAGFTLLVGIVLLLTGFQPQSQRVVVYLLYMLWLAIIMPGLFSLMSGRDDKQAALAYALLAFFNFSTSISMIQRGLVGPWIPVT